MESLFRGSVNVSDPAVKAACGVGKGQKRVELDEGSINPNMNDGNMFRNVTPKTYKILEAQLAQSEPEEQAPPAAQPQPAQSMQPVHAQPGEEVFLNVSTLAQIYLSLACATALTETKTIGRSASLIS